MVAVWLSLLGASALSVWLGRLGPALALAAVKAILVGLQFMELNHAAALHRRLFVGGVVALAALVAALAFV